MSVLNREPSCVDWIYRTVEAANSMYCLLPNAPSHSFTESFGLSADGKWGGVRRKLMPLKKQV
jgi:hypothetical protein